jgi:hypothetical protein
MFDSEIENDTNFGMQGVPSVLTLSPSMMHCLVSHVYSA